MTDTKHTRPCMHAAKGNECTIKDCEFAHNENELIAINCSNGNECYYRDTTCHFFHPNQTMEIYMQRRNFSFTKENKKKKDKVWQAISQKQTKPIKKDTYVQALKRASNGGTVNKKDITRKEGITIIEPKKPFVLVEVTSIEEQERILNILQQAQISYCLNFGK